MYDPTLPPLDAADAAFDDLVATSPQLVLDGAVIGHGLPARLIRLDELKPLLLHSSTPYDARDAAVTELLRRGRGGDPEWVIGLSASHAWSSPHGQPAHPRLSRRS